MRALAASLAFCTAACATASGSTSGAQLPADLQRVVTDYANAWEMHDAKSVAALFIDDGRIVMPNACAPGPGRETATRCYAGSGGPLHLRPLDHRIDGDTAYIIGEYALDETDQPRGRFTLVLVRQGDRWFIVSDMDRSYAPPPAN